MTTSSQLRRNDRHAVSGFGQREQGMWRVAFDENVRLEFGEAAGGIEGFANYEARIQEQQPIRRELADFDCAALAQRKRRMAGRKQINMVQYKTAETWVIGLDDGPQILSKMNLAAFQHAHSVEPGRLE